MGRMNRPAPLFEITIEDRSLILKPRFPILEVPGKLDGRKNIMGSAGFQFPYTLTYLDLKGCNELDISKHEYEVLLMRVAGRRNCYTCKHIEYVQGEAWDSSGYCCNRRDYAKQKDELKHLKQLEKDSYLRKGKKCHEPR